MVNSFRKFIGISFVVLLWSCFGENSTYNSRNYLSYKYGEVSVIFPTNWEIERVNYPTMFVAKRKDCSSDNFCPNVVVTIDSLLESVSLVDYYSKVIDGISSEGYTINKTEEKIDRKDNIALLEYEGAFENNHWTGAIIALRKNGMVYVVHYFGPAVSEVEGYKVHQSLVAHVLNEYLNSSKSVLN